MKTVCYDIIRIVNLMTLFRLNLIFNPFICSLFLKFPPRSLRRGGISLSYSYILSGASTPRIPRETAITLFADSASFKRAFSTSGSAPLIRQAL